MQFVLVAFPPAQLPNRSLKEKNHFSNSFRLLLFKLPSEEIPRGGQRVGAWEDLPATSLHGLGSQCLRSSLCLHAEGLLTMHVTMTVFSS